MLVSHRYKFIYTKTRKTGGTSVECYFERFCMPSDQWVLRHERDEYVSEFGIVGFRGTNVPKGCVYWNHMPAAQIREELGREVWDAYFKFCVIRNPYDKVVSAFYFDQRGTGRVAMIADVQQERMKFEDWLREGSQLPVDRDIYTIDGKFCLDAVIRYESLAVDIQTICVRLGLPWEPSLLPRFKAGLRPSNAMTNRLYTDRSRMIVEKAFAFELEYFNYSFPTQ